MSDDYSMKLAQYAVIFSAELNEPDQEYFDTAAKLRTLATGEYGCLGISSSCENGKEITVSYWNDLKDVMEWKQDPEHLAAQRRGKSRWYNWYSFHYCVHNFEYF